MRLISEPHNIIQTKEREPPGYHTRRQPPRKACLQIKSLPICKMNTILCLANKSSKRMAKKLVFRQSLRQWRPQPFAILAIKGLRCDPPNIRSQLGQTLYGEKLQTAKFSWYHQTFSGVDESHSKQIKLIMAIKLLFSIYQQCQRSLSKRQPPREQSWSG